MGGFTSKVVTDGQTSEIKHGVVIVATGATEQQAQDLRLRPERPGPHAARTVRPPGPRRALAARQGHRGDDPVRRAAQRRAPLLQPGLLHDGGQERPAPQGALPGRADHGALPRHADLRLPRGGLPRGPRERASCSSGTSRTSRRSWTSTAACACRSASRRSGATWRSGRTWSSWPHRWCPGPTGRNSPNCSACR